MLHTSCLSDLVAQSLKIPTTDTKAISNIKINWAIQSTAELHPIIEKHFIKDNQLYIPNIVYAIVLYDLFTIGREKVHKGMFSYSLKIERNKQPTFNISLQNIQRATNELKDAKFNTEEKDRVFVEIVYKGIQLRKFHGNLTKSVKTNPHKKNKKNAFYNEFKYNELENSNFEIVEFPNSKTKSKSKSERISPAVENPKKKKRINKNPPEAFLTQDQKNQPPIQQPLPYGNLPERSIPVLFPQQLISPPEYYSVDKKSNYLIPEGNDDDIEFEKYFENYKNLQYTRNNFNFFQPQYSENISNRQDNMGILKTPTTNTDNTLF